MLETFKTRLKAKSTAAGANLTQARLDAMSAKLNAKFPNVTDEAQHDASIEELYDAETLKDFAAIDDFQRAKAAREAAKKKEPEKKEPEKKEAAKDDDVPAWAQALIDQNKTLAEKISGFEKEKTQGTIKQQAATKLKDIPAKYYENWQLPESEDQLDAFVEKVTTGYEGFKQDLTNQGLSLVGTPPAAGGGAAGAGKVHPSIKAFADKQVELAKQQVQKT